jgi:integrase/recombinase XerD
MALTGPHRPIIEESISAVVKSRMQKLGIESPRQGPQSIRHSFATQLLHNGSSYGEISQLLGHRDTKSVAVYAKLDIKRLREVSELDLIGNL